MESYEERDPSLVSSSNCSLHEYAEQLRLWLNQAYQWQTASYFMPFPIINQINTPPPIPSTPNVQQIPAGESAQQRRPAADTNANPTPFAGRVFEVPQLTKRIAAELIDFGILFVMKAVIMLAVLDSWDLIDPDLLDVDNLDNIDENYDFAMLLTTNLVVIEIIHRFLVVGYEVWFTMRNGTTPGKKMMGLKVVHCVKATPLGGNRVLVEPARDLSFWRSMSRAAVKNLGTVLLFPTFLPFLIVQNNRTLYDVFCSTIVVVEN